MTVAVHPSGWVSALDFHGTGLVPCAFVNKASMGLSDFGKAWLKANLLKSTEPSQILPPTAPKLCVGSSVQELGGRFSVVGTILPPANPRKED